MPPGIVHDEVHIPFNATSIAVTGEHAPGTLTGIIGTASGEYQSGTFGELLTFILVPWVKLFGLSWPWVKVPFIFLSALQVWLVYLLAKMWFGKKVGLVAILFMSINPWGIHFGRTLYEQISFVFYLWAIYLFFRQPSKNIGRVLVLYLVGFGSYFAAKPQLILLGVTQLVAAHLIPLRDKIKPARVMLFLFIVTTIIYFIVLGKSPAGGRIQEVGSHNSEEIVAFKKNTSLHYPTKFVVNKVTQDILLKLENFLEGISAKSIFFSSYDEVPLSQTILDHGPLYTLDLPFVIVAMFILFLNKRKIFIIISCLIFIGLVPGTITSYGQSPVRAGFTFPILVIVSSYGVVWATRHSMLMRLFLVLGYTASCLFFLNSYFVRAPLAQSDYWLFSDRVLSRFLNLTEQSVPNQKILVATSQPKQLSYVYLMYSNKYKTKSQIQQANDELNNKSYGFGMVTFTDDCSRPVDAGTMVIYAVGKDCSGTEYESVIASLVDAGSIYLIKNDKLCKSFPKYRYPRVRYLEDFQVELLEIEDFCKSWITHPESKLTL